jgi:hypothetical protein
MPRISDISEEEDTRSMPGAQGSIEEQDLGSMPWICNGATMEDEGRGPGFHTQNLQPVP